ncbi:hypothetical protein NECAME_12288 [Necator americanus]|uniref:Uncharacterized protein n=1 Tax=Necator americanus TaxID=51031 RepID=W2T3N1_NECAM|nr:hypothetical protein NECAME_12288 [Necator americanus]ETN75587.1 hypothetical protein NECAME_12288 [Necator americanus]
MLVLRRTPTSPTPLLSHVPKNSSSPAPYAAFTGWRRLVSGKHMVASSPRLALHPPPRCMTKVSTLVSMKITDWRHVLAFREVMDTFKLDQCV